MALKALNRKAEALTARSQQDVETYAYGDCCPGFLPGWEVGESGQIDPCTIGPGNGWQGDLPACHPGCYWTAQVPDDATWDGWLDSCGNVATDWQSFCTVPD